jgi:photosystem II stability/assembly factor-like uncharacterized protein
MATLKDTFTGHNTYYSMADNQTWRGQTWTAASAYTLTGCQLRFYRVGAYSGNVEICIRATDGGGLPTGGNLASFTLDGSTITTNTSGDWVLRYFDSTMEITQGVKYVVLVRPLGVGLIRIRGSSGGGYGNGGHVYTFNGGTDWAESGTADLPFAMWAEDAEESVNAAYLGSAGNFIVAAADNGVFLSTDFGDNWTEYLPDASETTDWVKCICSSDGTYIIVVSSAGAVYRSANSGSSWAAITPAGGDSFSVTKMATSDDGQYMAIVGVNSTDTSKSLYLSTDYGATWAYNNPISTTTPWTDVDISNDGTTIGVSATNQFYCTFDSGSNWREQGLAASAEVWAGLSISGNGETALIANAGTANEYFRGVKTELYTETTWAETDITGVARNFLDDLTQAAQQTTLGLGTGDSPTFVGLTLSGLTASRLVATNGSKQLSSVAALSGWIAGTANEINVTDDGSGGLVIGIVDPLIVSKGGTGLATLTDHGLLLGSGTDAVTPLGAATNGQLPIGSTGADPVLAALTGTANQVAVANGAGTITISTPQDTDTAADIIFNSATLTNLFVLDTVVTGAASITDGTAFEGDTSGGSFSLGLPALTGNGRVLLICCSGSNTLTLDPSGSETINGDTTFDLIEDESLILVDFGTEWRAF